MTGRAPGSPRPPEALRLWQRVAVFQLVVVAHLCLLLMWLPWLATPRVTPSWVGGQEARQAGRVTEIVFSRAPRAAAAPPVESAAPPAPPAPPAAPLADADDAQPIAHPEDLGLPPPGGDIAPDPVIDGADKETIAATAQAGTNVKCDLAALLQASLQPNALVASAIDSIPPASRSVANAIMVWDGRWVDPAAGTAPAAMVILRAAIVDGIHQASPACRETPVYGPILVPLAGRSGTTVLALGSGVWRAADLLSWAAETAPAPAS